MEAPFTPSFFRRLQQLKIRTRRAFLGSRQGQHRSLRRGHGLEFSEYRAYAPGDDFRHIDWSVYGRTDRLYVRQFREEQNLNVMIMMDTSASMFYPDENQKFELAKNLALSLGYVALTDSDSVVFSLLGQKNTPKYNGARALPRAIKELNAVTPTENFDYVKETIAAVASLRIPGKCFVLSDFLFEEESQFAMLDVLRSRNFEIAVLQILSPEELQLDVEMGETVVDSETGEEILLSLGNESKREYARLLASHVEALEHYCNKAGIAYALVPSNQAVDEVMLSRLPELGLLK